MTAPKAITRYRRFKGWDYTKGASLFITIATSGEGLALYWKADRAQMLARNDNQLQP